jgi:hypothetical protein
MQTMETDLDWIFLLWLINKIFFTYLKKEIFTFEISVIKDLALNPDLDPDPDLSKGLYAESESKTLIIRMLLYLELALNFVTVLWCTVIQNYWTKSAAH